MAILAKTYFCQSGFYHGKNVFFHHLDKTCQPWLKHNNVKSTFVNSQYNCLKLTKIA